MTGHLLRKDWRARKLAVIVWIGLLALCLLVPLLPLDTGADPTRQGVSLLFLALLPFACLMLLLGVVGPTVGEDSPARRDRFLATRPLPARALWVSKSLFLGLTVLLPVVVLSALFLIIATRDLRVVVLGTTQMALLAMAVTLFITGFSALWSTKLQTVLGLATLGATFLVFGLAGIKWLPTQWFDDLLSRHPRETTIGLLVAGGLLCGIATRRRLLRSHLALRLAVLAAATLTGLTVATFLPSLGTGAGAGDQVATLSPEAVGHRFSWSDGPTLNLRLKLDRPGQLAPEEGISWLWKRVKVNGETRENPYFHRVSLGSHWSQQDLYQESLGKQVESMLGRRVDWVLFNRMRASFGTADTAQCEIPGLDPASAEAVGLELDLEAMVYRWECEAEMPLAEGSRTTSGDADWSVTGVFGPGDSRQETAILLERRGPMLWFSDEETERHRPAYARARERVFLLHDPNRGRVFVGLSASPQSYGFLPTGYPTLSVVLRASGDGRTDDLLEESWTDLRLLVFRPRLVERLERRWTPPRPLVPAHLPLPGNHGGDPPRDLSAGEFARRYERLATPAAEAAGIGPFLDQVLALASRCDDSVDHAREPWVRDLAALAAQDPDAFLSRFGRLDANDYRARRMLLEAMKHGFTDANADTVAQALARDPELLPLVLFRGWSGKAREILLEQFDYGIRSRDLLESLARLDAFDEPARRAALFADLRLEADATAYRILRRLEGTDSRLDEIIAGFGGDYPRLLPGMLVDSRRHFDLPLTHGSREAVLELHRVARTLPDRSHGGTYELQELIDDHFEHPEITGNQRHDGDSLIGWFLERDPEHFRFDPVSRRFAWQNP